MLGIIISFVLGAVTGGAIVYTHYSSITSKVAAASTTATAVETAAEEVKKSA